MMLKLPYYDDLVGVPFRWFGRDPARGLDCNGVILEVYRRAGIKIPDPCAPDTPEDAFDGILERAEKPPWQPGDILMFARAEVALSAHAGVYVGLGLVLHSTVDRGSRIDHLPLPGYSALFAHRHCRRVTSRVNNGEG